MKLVLTATAVAALALFSGGCTRIFGEAAGAVLGGKGKTIVLQPISPDSRAYPLGAYKHFQLQPLTDNTGGQMPAQLNSDLHAEFAKELRDEHVLNYSEGKTLVIRGALLHYENSRLAATDQVFGPLEEAVVRVELVDADSGKVIGVANCVGRSNVTDLMGPHSKAEGLAKAFAGWIAENYPPSQKVSKKMASRSDE